MQIFDIAQEVFTCVVFPGDPKPEREVISDMNDGALYNLTAFRMCAHNGTHVDSPRHFYKDGKTLSDMDLSHFVGWCYVAAHEGDITPNDITAIIARARQTDPECARRILIKGKATLTNDAADVAAQSDMLLFGNESQTVGPENAPMAAHLKLLGREIALLEGIRLGHVPEGRYLLNAAPLHLGNGDGAPCRAVLIAL
jgi:arylformamidase